MNQQPITEGEEITLGAKTYILPPIPLIKMAKIGALMKGGDITQDESYVEALIDAVWWSLQRNYGRDLPRDVVELNLDAKNINDVMTKFMSVNNFVMTAKMGEALAGQ